MPVAPEPAASGVDVADTADTADVEAPPWAGLLEACVSAGVGIVGAVAFMTAGTGAWTTGILTIVLGLSTTIGLDVRRRRRRRRHPRLPGRRRRRNTPPQLTGAPVGQGGTATSTAVPALLPAVAADGDEA